MSLKEKLNADFKEAMKAKDKVRKDTISFVRAAIKQVEVDTREEVDDQGVASILAKQIKMRKDALKDFEIAGRDDMISEYMAEINVLMEYMPQQLLTPDNEEALFALDLNAKTCNWDFFVEHPLTLITGPGGQGKTTFLYALYKKHENTPEAFKHIFIVPLINLTELNITDVNVDENLIERYITSRFLKCTVLSALSSILILRRWKLFVQKTKRFMMI